MNRDKEDLSRCLAIIGEFIDIFEDPRSDIVDFNEIYIKSCKVLGLEPKEDIG